MSNRISDDVLDAIAAQGFDIYQSSDPRWQSFAFFTRGDNIGYFENDRLRGWRLSTVHIPNSQTGTGYSMTDDRDTVELTRDYLSRAFVSSPAWARSADRASVRKWPSVDAWLKANGKISCYVKTREGAK
jgi:hypothetical protein